MSLLTNCAVSALLCLAVATANAAPRVVIMEPNDLVTVEGEVGNDASFQRSFRLRLEGEDSARIRFLPSDLRSRAGALIDRRQLAVPGNLQLTTQPQDFRLDVTGVTRPGEYEGSVEIAPETAPDAAAHLNVKLIARPRSAITLAPETPSFAVKTASPCGRLTMWTLGRSVCEANHVVFLRTDSGVLPTGRAELVAVGPNGESLTDGGAVAVALDRDRVVMTINPAKISPGRYTGRVIIRFDTLASPVEIPVDLQVRIGPGWPLLAILIGVLVGQLARIMREYGDKQAALRLRFNRLMGRVRALSPNSQAAVKYLQDRADRAIDQAPPDTAANDLTNFETACDYLETLELYSLHTNFATANAWRAELSQIFEEGEGESATYRQAKLGNRGFVVKLDIGEELDFRMIAERETIGLRLVAIGYVAHGAGLEQRAHRRGAERPQSRR